MTKKSSMKDQPCPESDGEHPGLQHHPHQSEKFFAEVGLVTGDGGVWLRRQVLAMAQVNCTPAPYWLEMPLYQFRQWIRSSNDLIAERQRARKDGK